MKLIITLAFALITSVSFCQKDTSWIPKTDTVEFISVKDINGYLQELGSKVSHNDWETIKSAMLDVVNKAIDRKRKKKQ